MQSISIFCYKIVILFICYYNGITRLNYVKPRLTLVIWSFLKSQAISFQIDFNSCFPFYSDQHFCYLHPIARTSYGTNDTSRNVTGYSNQNTHAQFPKKIPNLIIWDHYWLSISLLLCAIRTFLLHVCHYYATLNYTSKS